MDYILRRIEFLWPITCYIITFLLFSSSFRFGRLRVVIVGMLTCSVFGLIKSFSTSYIMYIIVSGKWFELNLFDLTLVTN